MTDKTAVSISYVDKGQQACFVARIFDIDGERELVISRVSGVPVIADHTFLPSSLRGTGIASAMIDAMIKDARATEYRIVPLCPFVRAQSLKHPEWADDIQH